MTLRIACLALLVSSLVPVTAFSQAPAGDWVGHRVVLTSPTAQLKVESRVVADGRTFRIYKVEHVNGPWFWLVSERVAGWARRDDVLMVGQSESYFSGEINKAPTSWAYTTRGECRLDRRARNAAKADFDTALQLDPNCADAYRGLGGFHAAS